MLSLLGCTGRQCARFDSHESHSRLTKQAKFLLFVYCYGKSITLRKRIRPIYADTNVSSNITPMAFVKADFRWPKFRVMGIINWLPQVEDERYYDPHFAPSIDIIVIAPISRIVNFGSSRITCTDSWLMGLPYYILPTTITFVVKRGSNYRKTCGFPRYGKFLSVF